MSKDTKQTGKETFYFSHDYNTRSDQKIKRLMMEHGMLGYGVYWSIVEDLYNNANALQTDYKCIAFEMRCDTELVRSVIEDFDLFIIQGNEFGSLSVERRMNERSLKSAKARESANARWNNANALQTQSDSNAIKERKVKESKGKESEEQPPQPVADAPAQEDGMFLKLDEQVKEVASDGPTYNQLVGGLIVAGIEAKAELNHQRSKQKKNKPESIEVLAAKIKEFCPQWSDDLVQLRAEQWYTGMQSRYPDVPWRISGKEVKDWEQALRNKITFWKQDDLKEQQNHGTKKNSTATGTGLTADLNGKKYDKQPGKTY